MNLLELSQTIRQLRQERRMTVEQLAQRSGFSKGFISQVENFRISPSLKALNRIAEALGVDLKTLFETSGKSAEYTFGTTAEGMELQRDDSAEYGMRYLALLKKGHAESEIAMKQTDYMTYRLICLGFLLLTVVILSGAIWAEQAWSRWWSWDPKETWALITWILYAIYLHQRMRMKWQGKRMAWFAVIAVMCVIFTFAGVNKLLPGLHSYAV